MIKFLFRVYADFLSKKWKILSVRLKNAQGENGRLQCKYECRFHFVLKCLWLCALKQRFFGRADEFST